MVQVFDTVYVPAKTPFLIEAQKQGARPVGGLGMLARQGAASLRIWSDMEPDEGLMIETLKRVLLDYFPAEKIEIWI